MCNYSKRKHRLFTLYKNECTTKIFASSRRSNSHNLSPPMQIRIRAYVFYIVNSSRILLTNNTTPLCVCEHRVDSISTVSVTVFRSIIEFVQNSVKCPSTTHHVYTNTHNNKSIVLRLNKHKHDTRSVQNRVRVRDDAIEHTENEEHLLWFRYCIRNIGSSVFVLRVSRAVLNLYFIHIYY